jgi:hypothetical protein
MVSTNRGPNPPAVAWAVLRALRVRRPQPGGRATAEHHSFGRELHLLRAEGIAVLPSRRDAIAEYRDQLQAIDPDEMHRSEALAYWLNLYNAGALALAAEAADRQQTSVLRLPGAFTRQWARVAGEDLSLTEIEHGKIRRFGDPRIHGALVCGSASCPTLRFEPYAGPALDHQLDDQMRSFLAAGGASIDRSRDQLLLSRIFLWFGGDFTRPQRMPTWLPPGTRALQRAVGKWLDPESRNWVADTNPKTVFRPYDWELACAVA